MQRTAGSCPQAPRPLVPESLFLQTDISSAVARTLRQVGPSSSSPLKNWKSYRALFVNGPRALCITPGALGFPQVPAVSGVNLRTKCAEGAGAQFSLKSLA